MNQRIIKFRAWGKNSKEFLHTGEGVFGLTLKNLQNIHDIDVWEFQQYTGLKDKNGKEIYEGDIARFYFDAIEGYGKDSENEKYTEMIDVVEMIEGCWCLTCDIGSSSYLYRHNQHIEIIGNIYENPDLIK